MKPGEEFQDRVVKEDEASIAGKGFQTQALTVQSNLSETSQSILVRENVSDTKDEEEDLVNALNWTLHLDEGPSRPEIVGHWVLWDESVGNVSDLNFRLISNATWLPRELLMKTSGAYPITINVSESINLQLDEGETTPLEDPMIEVQGDKWVFQR